MKLFLAILITIPCLAWAQEDRIKPDARRSCRIVFPERPSDSPKVAFLFDGKQNHEVTLPSMNFSEVIALPSGDITIIMTPDKINDPKEIPANLPRLMIAEGVRHFYILVTLDPENAALQLQMNMVNAGDDTFRPGETLWFNLTDHRIVAKLEGSNMLAQPRSQAVSKAPLAKSGYYSAQFAYHPQGKGDLQRITEQLWWHDAKSRHLGFIVNTGGRLPKIYFYRDFRDE